MQMRLGQQQLFIAGETPNACSESWTNAGSSADFVPFVLQQRARLVEWEPRAARHHFRRVAIAEVAQEIR